MRGWRLSVALLFFAACGGTPPVQESPEPEKPRTDPVRDCALAIKDFQNAALEKSGAIARCATMWQNQTCRDAWSAESDDPTAYVMKQCSAAYCERYTELALCAVPSDAIDLLSDSHDWFSLWRAFNRTVLSDELALEAETGVAGDVAVSLLMVLSQAEITPITGQVVDTIHLFFSPAETNWSIDASVKRGDEPTDKNFQVPRKNDAADFDLLIAFLERHGAGVGTAYVHSSKPLDDATRVHLLLGLRSIGISVIEFDNGRAP